MRLFSRAWRFAALGALTVASPVPGVPRVAPVPDFVRTPLRFERNDGQFDPSVLYLAHSGAMLVALTDRGASLLDTRGTSVSIHVAGASTPAVVAREPLSTRSNYFFGDDPTKWRTNVPNFAQVTYASVLPGVDLVFHGSDGRLEYDFVVAPGASADSIVIEVDGADALSLDEEGDLRIAAGGGVVVQHRPRVYQRDGGGERDVRGAYRILDDRRVGFEVAAHDRSRPLVIDPVVTLVYGTYLGSPDTDSCYASTADGFRSTYVTGETASLYPSFPTKNPLFTKGVGFLSKVNPAGTALVYSTYFGGSSYDWGLSVSADAAGNAYVTGIAQSTDFPTSAGAFQKTHASTATCAADAFVMEIDSTGATLMYSSYLGGAGCDVGNGIAADASGHAFVTGFTRSTDFPTHSATQAAYAGRSGAGSSCGQFDGGDAFVTEVDVGGAALVYSTYYGGSDDDEGFGIAVDASGNAYVAGGTVSTDFPTLKALQGYQSGASAFVAKFAPGGAPVYSTYFGSGCGAAHGIAADATGNAFVAGAATSIPLKNSLQGYMGQVDAFVAQIDPTGSSLVYSTYLGGSAADQANAVAVDVNAHTHVVGLTYSSNFPTLNALQSSPPEDPSPWVAELLPGGSALLYSTYLDGTKSNNASGDVAFGVAVDGVGNTYVGGQTSSTNFPTTAGAVQPANAGAQDCFLARLQWPVLADAGADAAPDAEADAGGNGDASPDASQDARGEEPAEAGDDAGAWAGGSQPSGCSCRAAGESSPDVLALVGAAALSFAAIRVLRIRAGRARTSLAPRTGRSA